MFVHIETQKEYKDIGEALLELCGNTTCNSCPFNDAVPREMSCGEFVDTSRETAMGLLGLEEKEDSAFEFDEKAFKNMLGLSR